jgi:hypothetical protein
LPVLLYGCESFSFSWREKGRLRVFENRVLKGIFGPNRDEVTGEWRKLHIEELNDPYCSPNIVRVFTSRKMRWGGAFSAYGGKEMCVQILGGET